MNRYIRKKDINIIPNTRSQEIPNSKNKKIKFDFKSKKENTLRSLNEVEHFLCNLKHLNKYIKLYFILK